MIYEREGPEITISHPRSEEKLAISGEDLLSHGDPDTVAVVEAEPTQAYA